MLAEDFFTAACLKALVASNVDPATAANALARVGAALPHLSFATYFLKKSATEQAIAGTCKYSDQTRRTLHLTVTCGNIEIKGRCSRYSNKTIDSEDKALLMSLLDEAARAIARTQHQPTSLSDFGLSSVAKRVQALAGVNFDCVPLFQLLNSLAIRTYESRRLSYGVILVPSKSPGTTGVGFFSALENKRFLRLTDGYSTALVVGGDSGIRRLLALRAPTESGAASRQRPLWLAPLATAAEGLGGVGVALTRNGDILVTHRGRLHFSSRSGVWTAWRHSDLLAVVRSYWQMVGHGSQLSDLLSYCYQVALDLSFRRTGGLIAIAQTKESVERLVASSRDLVGATNRGPERSLDAELQKRSMHKLDRRIVSDLASLDGAIVATRKGTIRAYGAMLHSSKRKDQGSRTRAAIAASRRALVMKVSSDGDIKIYRNGSAVLSL